MDVRDYAAHDAVGLADLIRSGQVNAAEVHAAARSAIEAVNPQLNAVVGPLFDAPLDHDASGPFAGVPFAIKDLVCHAAGVTHEYGSRLTAGFAYPYDTSLMARWRAAGLATMGRTNTPEMGFNASTEPVANGPTRNPWDTTRSPGGSSGGSSALVAARALPVAHANDGGGSIRIPAANCGLVGLKPTRGRTPVGPDADDPLYGLGIEFAVTRTVRDAAALLDAVEGPDVGDRFAIARPARPYATEVGADPGRLRVMLSPRGWADVFVDPACVAAAEATGRVLAELGHEVDHGTPPVDVAGLDLVNLRYWCGFLAQAVYGLSETLGREVGDATVEHTVARCAEFGRGFTMFDLAEAGAVQNAITRAVGGWFTDVDVLVTPTVSRPAWLLGELDADDEHLDAPGWVGKVFTYAPFTALFNVTGQPAVSLPVATSPDGLPVGVQLVGRVGSEDVLLRVAAQLEQAMPWSDRAPTVLAG